MDKNLLQRLITGILFVGVVVGCIIWSEWSFAVLFLLITVLGLWEFYTLANHVPAKPWKIYGTIIGGVIFALCFFSRYYTLSWLPFLIIPFLFFPFFGELYTKSQHPFTNLAYTFLGWLYLAVPMSLWALLLTPSRHISLNDNPEAGFHADCCFENTGTYQWQFILGFFIILWTSDSLAYVCGRIWGKHKLFERISPKKTWEGFIGGALFTILAAWLVGSFFTDLSRIHWMVIAAIVSITGTFGDLTESMFKRSIGVKDSGKLLPGHGGILDRFDAVLLSSPFVTTYLLIVNALQSS